MELGAFFKNDGPGAGDIAEDLAVDEGGGGGDRAKKLDAGTFFDAEIPAEDFSDDFPVAADDQVARAFDRASEFAKHGEVVALEGDAGDDAGFLDHHVAAGLDAAVPVLGDVIVDEADVIAAFRALARLGFGDGGVSEVAVKARDVTRRLDGIENPHE